MGTLWTTEPILVALLGSGALWMAVFGVMAAFGHPLTPTQQTALLALLAVLGGVIGRSQVTPTAKAPGGQP